MVTSLGAWPNGANAIEPMGVWPAERVGGDLKRGRGLRGYSRGLWGRGFVVLWAGLCGGWAWPEGVCVNTVVAACCGRGFPSRGVA